MGDPKREELKVANQRAVLAAVADPGECQDRNAVLDELKGLVKTAGVQVVGEIIQFRDTPHPAHCLGTGKLEELSLLVKSTDAEMVVFRQQPDAVTGPGSGTSPRKTYCGPQ